MRRLLFFLTFHFSFFIAPAQHSFYRNLPLNESGSSLRVNDLAFDPQGYLWLGTEAGLYRYNGRAFTQLPDSTGSSVTALTHDGRQLFTGYVDGRVGRWSGGSFHLLYTAGAPVSCILPTAMGLLVGTQGEGVALLRGSHAARFTTAAGLTDDYVYSITATTKPAVNQHLLIGTDRGVTILSYQKGKLHFTRINTANTPGIGDNIVRVIRRQQGVDHVFLVGTQAGGYCMLYHARGRWNVLRFPLWQGGQINDAIPITNVDQIIGAEKGLWIKRADDSARHLLQGKSINRVIADRIGNLWAATNDGLSMVTAGYLASIDPGPAYRLRALSALAADPSGILWYAQDEQLYSYHAKQGSRPRYKAPETITTLYADPYHRLWIGTLGGGLLCMENGSSWPVANVENLRGGHILNIAGRGDTLWVSSLNGVEVLHVPVSGRTSVIGRHGRGTGAGSDYVYQLYPDRRGRLWMATDGAGVVMWDGKEYHRWDSTSGLNSRVVYSVTEDARGNIWAGTLEGGLCRWNGKQWKSYHREHGLQDNTVLAVAPSGNGSVIAVNERGADQWLPKSAEFRQYSRRMGLHIDSFSKVLNAVAADGKGHVYVPYEHGFLQIKPAAQTPAYKPGITLRVVELFFKPVDTSRHDFASDENGIGFRFEGIHLAAPERLRYRYRLEGYNDDWVETGDEVVHFPRLAPGRYRFQVQASLQRGFENASTASYAFRIAAPLWRRPWFWSVIAVAAAAAGYMLLKRRDQARQRLARLEQARLRAEYEHLKSQVNPHFLFNSLNTLVGLIEEDPHAAARYTQQLSDLFRDTISFRSRDLVLLEEEWEVLQKYLYIQQSRFGNALQLKADLPEEILRSKRIIPLALQLLVENAIKHNIVSRAQPLVIFITATNDSVTVRNRLQPKKLAEAGAGMGLQNIRSRFALLSAGPVTSGREDQDFIVTLPLL